MSTQVNQQNFWASDLEKIEAAFLPKNAKITDLKPSIDARAPVQGSVLLDSTVNIDKVVSAPTLRQRLLAFLR